ncbi:signal peptidase I [uncultured Psychroserpens sp.]|uniref:signal peptidase I n=1 Tax=uncultured Psychroserpens sp. TaxID=255436 RepID=UPI00263130E3|nr:signal peptidase I [uncultured Psychroserpens sp.]
MTITQWLIFILIIQIIHGLGTWKLYVKAGRQAWEAFIPVYNAVILMKIINRQWWWTILLFVPIVNLIMLPVVWVETARSFGKNEYLDTFLAVVTLGFYNYYLNYVADVTYVENRDINPKSSSGDWTSSILFAIVAATIVHTYFIQPFTIPSSSLEKSLLVGDFLFVSKFHYGARVPMSTVAAPMVHDTIPILKVKSYLYNDRLEENKTSLKNKLQLPYMRLPGFESIERNDIVVFNQPADTLLDMNDFTPDRNYYKPIDKKTNLVKRCVAIPGDSLEIIDGHVFINGEKSQMPDRSKLQFLYSIDLKGNYSGAQIMNALKRYDITDFGMASETRLLVHASDEAIQQAKNHPNFENITRQANPKNIDGNVFPRAPQFPWNYDNFGPIYIPKEGETIELNMEVLPLYKRLISEYESNTLTTNGSQIIINGQPATSYTFKQDYYWMMGDNRNNSVDSRGWGYVPFDHVVGKPVFIWMSWDGLKNPRWERWFTTVSGTGTATSYLIPFVVLLLAWFGFNKWRKRKNA